MCGRYSFVPKLNQIQNQFPNLIGDISSLPISYNIAPSQQGPIITSENPDLIQYYHWGLVPHWAKSKANLGHTINARIEGIDKKPSYRGPIKNRRCIVLADSYYEWKPASNKKKIPYRIFNKSGHLLLLGGVYDLWNENNSSQIYPSYSIITVPSNDNIKELHHRMPLIFSHKEDAFNWINSETSFPDQVIHKLPQLKPNYLDYYPVSTALNHSKAQGSQLHIRVDPPPKQQLGLFDL